MSGHNAEGAEEVVAKVMSVMDSPEHFKEQTIHILQEVCLFVCLCCMFVVCLFLLYVCLCCLCVCQLNDCSIFCCVSGNFQGISIISLIEAPV